MTNTINEREIALDVLMEINEREQYIHVLLNDALRKYQYLEKNERAFITRLVKGTMERRMTLDYVINQVSSVRVNKMKPLIRNLMRMSVYQMMYMEQVPVSAVCNEAVKLAKKRHFTNLSGFVNGVLRNISRQLPAMELPDDYSVRYSVPQELADMLKASYGEETMKLILESFLKDSKVSAVVNTIKITRTELMERLTAQGIEVTDAPYVENAFIMSDYNYLEEIPEFIDGMFQIQDISSMLAGMIASPSKDSTVIDVCAAPGGKSIFAALMMEGTGHVISRDVSEKKTGQIEENVQRLGLGNISVETADALEHNLADEETADMLLADIPCSGLGIIGRKPDIKYNVSQEKLDGIVRLQRDILDSVCSYVKHGGYLVYSTCTLNPKENEENVRYIMEKGFAPVDINDLLPESLVNDAKKAGEKYEIFAAVCDGIGGLPDGAQASRSAVQTLLTAFRGNPQAAPSYLYQQTIDWMDRAVAEQTAGGGSTIVSVWARGDGLYWLSIGDSGLFLLRGGRLRRLVPEHNYAAFLNQRLEKGEISQLFYDREIRRGRALTSYLGMNGIGLYEQNQQPMAIERGDVILLCSDGLMQALSTQTLEELLSQPGTAQQLTKKLQTVLLSHSDAMQDNTTLVLIKRHR